jgi:hypothetical protein
MRKSAKWGAGVGLAGTVTVLAAVLEVGPLVIVGAAAGVFCAIMFGVSLSPDSKRDRIEHRKDRIADKQHREEQTALVLAAVQAVQEQRALVGADPTGIQRRTLELAAEIAHFLEQRLKDYQPPDEWIPSMPGRSPLDFYDLETRRLYWQLFREPVAELRSEVASKMKLRNPDLDVAYGDLPSDNGAIYKVINGLRGLAETIGAAKL